MYGVRENNPIMVASSDAAISVATFNIVLISDAATHVSQHLTGDHPHPMRASRSRIVQVCVARNLYPSRDWKWDH